MASHDPADSSDSSDPADSLPHNIDLNALFPSSDSDDVVTEPMFLRVCELSLDRSDHAHLYDLMRAEATAGLYHLLDAVPLQEFRATTADGSRPSSLDHVSEAAMRMEILRIFNSASAATSEVYAITNVGDAGDNWIIRWLLFDAAGY